MNEPAFPPNIAAALDRVTVPPLPPGFGDRLMVRIATGDLPSTTSAELPSLRHPLKNRLRWMRPGRILVSAALLGVATATAAASGVFGEPVYVPVVSEALARVQLVKLPVKKERHERHDVPEKPKVKSAKAEPPTVTGAPAVRQLYQKLQADSQFRALPPRERIAVARGELESMLRSGTVKPAEIRQAMQEIREERRAQRASRIEQANDLQTPRARSSADPVSRKQPLPRPPVSPEARAARQAAIRDLPAADRARLRALSHALRSAPLQERSAIRREIRSILQQDGIVRRPAENIDSTNEGNPDPTR